VLFWFVYDRLLFLGILAMSIFFDVVVSAQFSEGVVRLGLADYVGPPKDGKRPTGDVTQLATSVQGLLQMQAQINQLVEGLVERKVLRRQDPAAPAEQAPPPVA
jgi:hypothetical protein